MSKHKRTIKTTIKKSLRWCSQEYLFGKFLQITIKVSAAEFIFSKIPYFRIILLNTFRLVTLKYENNYFEAFYFRYSNNIQVVASNCKNLIKKLSMEIHLNRKVIKNIKQRFQLFLNRVHALVLCARFLFLFLFCFFFAFLVRRGSKLHTRKIRHDKIKFIHAWIIHLERIKNFPNNYYFFKP